MQDLCSLTPQGVLFLFLNLRTLLVWCYYAITYLFLLLFRISYRLLASFSFYPYILDHINSSYLPVLYSFTCKPFIFNCPGKWNFFHQLMHFSYIMARFFYFQTYCNYLFIYLFILLLMNWCQANKEIQKWYCNSITRETSLFHVSVMPFLYFFDKMKELIYLLL